MNLLWPPPGRSDRGSFLPVVVGIILVVLLFVGFFHQYMLQQFWAARRQGNASVVTTITYSLAMLAKQKIQQDILQNPEHPLSANLFQPLDLMTDIEGERLALDGARCDLSPLANGLFSTLSDVGDFSFNITYSCRKCDFSSVGAVEYCCEKEGLITLNVAVTLRRNDSTVVSEDLNVAFRVKVTGAQIPLLSKFNLFVQDAETVANSRRFNLVWTDPDGRLMPDSPAKPWILKNAPDELQSIPRSLNNFVCEPRGWVYFGGSRVCLNIARGWAGPVALSEGFHLFARGSRAGLYTTAWVGPNRRTALAAWDQGICYEIEAPGARDWWDFIKNYPSARNDPSVARANSIFRLFGAGNRPSPTLVLGEVYRGVISARAYKKLMNPPPHLSDFLDWIDDAETWRTASTHPPPEPDTPNIGRFCQDVGLSSGQDGLATYKQRYASRVGMQPFNISLAYIQHWQEANPLPRFDEEFQNRMVGATPAGLFFDVPQPFQMAEIRNLRDTSLEEIIARNLQVPGARTAVTINPGRESSGGGGADVLKCLQDRGLLSRKPGGGEWSWNLNGWVYVDVPDGQPPLTLELREPSRVISNGGLVLKSGNIHIRAPILTEGNKVLQLVTLRDGDITVETEGEVHAALTAVAGSVKTRQAGCRIFGAAAMHHFDLTSASQGAELTYNPLLSIVPTFREGAQPSRDCPEEPILAAHLEDRPMFLK